MKYSFIIPVYNRPDEIGELLASLCAQTLKDFEVMVVEDGSDRKCDAVVGGYSDRLDIHYIYKENGGPGPARNLGASMARGEYLLILDSDVVLPEGYLAAVDRSLAGNPAPAFGGPDSAHESFTAVQKAINYSMTSFFTTGGIRGGKKKLMKFYPRSFNMGVRKDLYDSLGGFAEMRVGEDMDLCMRIFESGATCALYRDAAVWHKRRTDFRKFFRQTHSFGAARVILGQRHPGTTKLVHLLPAAFTLGVSCLVLAAIVLLTLKKTGAALAVLSPVILYILLIFCDSLLRNRSLKVAALSVPAAFVQLVGYGSGYLEAFFSSSARALLKQSRQSGS